MAAVRADCKAKGLVLQGSDGDQDEIPIALTPWVVSREAARYLQTLFRGIRRTVNRVLAHYFEDPKLQEILPLRENELAWLKASCPEGIPRLQTIFERFDTNLGPEVQGQLSSFQIIEFNAVGVGCIYLMPAATEILQAHLLPRLKEKLPAEALTAPTDYRKLLCGELQAHAKAIDRPACRVALVERREATPGGVDEFTRMMPYFEAQGIPVKVGDPREIEHRDGELFLKESAVDVLYRDFQLEEVVSIKTHGGSVEGIEAAFSENRVVSTVFGEFDHKSLCELLTNPDFIRYFSPQELRAARRRIPWTRLIDERRTHDPAGREVDLLPYIREHRETLVLKPNRGYGGEGVVVGEAATAKEWDEALAGAIAKPKGWVVQEKVPIVKAPMIVLRGKGKLVREEQHVTLSVTATSRGVAFVGRCSPEPVVNISQGGGLVPVFLTR
ncbi:MAG: circularly permuted type 2 ATP-grasp protein [Candidatus Omnitrophica bacterium]|nr:circularly permuted type 2 ATP-grasp protein [Candidatus Omnitrophota bacterium]